MWQLTLIVYFSVGTVIVYFTVDAIIFACFTVDTIIVWFTAYIFITRLFTADKEQGTVLAEIGREIQRFFNLGIL